LKPLLLASRSPRREKILKFAGIPFRRVKTSPVIEKPGSAEAPTALVRRLAVQKAIQAAKRFPRDWALGADTVVVCGGRIFGKPSCRRDALKMLKKLSGGAHVVYTGVAFAGEGGRRILSHVEKTRVTFRTLTADELRRYLATREPYDKAGAYAIQGTARSWIRKWKGDYFTVMGLPLQWVIQMANLLGKTC
jgi:septum formation protein